MESGQLCKANYTPEVVNDYYLNCLIFNNLCKKTAKPGVFVKTKFSLLNLGAKNLGDNKT